MDTKDKTTNLKKDTIEEGSEDINDVEIQDFDRAQRKRNKEISKMDLPWIKTLRGQKIKSK